MTIVGSGAKFRGMERDVELYFDRDAFQKHVCGLVLHPLKGINLALHLYGPIKLSAEDGNKADYEHPQSLDSGIIEEYLSGKN